MMHEERLVAGPIAPNGRSVLERALGLVTNVKAGEAPRTLLLAFNVFLLLTAYGCIKPVRDALILALPRGAEFKIYMSAAIAGALLIAVPVYGKVATRLPRNSLIIAVTVFFASHLVVFYKLGTTLGPSMPLALAFYLWIGVFDLMIVAQFWAFANDLHSEADGIRLFPLIALGASMGAVAGSGIAKALIARVGIMPMLLIAATILLVSAGITQIVHAREVARPRSTASEPASPARLGTERGNAFKLVLGQRYLRLIAVFCLLLTVVKSNGEYMLAKLVEDAAREGVASGVIRAQRVGDYIGTFYADYLFYLDVLSLILQGLVVSRLIKYLGVGTAVLVMPLVALVDGAVIALWPLLAIVTVGKLAENATLYSLNNTVVNMLWLPTTRRAKYLGKQAVDTFFVRTGGAASAVLVFAGAHVMHWPMRAFALCNLMLGVAWLLLVRAIVRERTKLRAGLPPE